jgi:hypothetical protein
VSVLRRVGGFAYEFVVGDDWQSAAGVVAALALCYVLAHSHVSAWWVMPAAVVLVLTASVVRRARRPSG